MAKARQDGKPIVYIGFGSITVPNAAAMTRSIIKAVTKSQSRSTFLLMSSSKYHILGGVRAIIAKGWSSRMHKQEEHEIEFPPECYPVSVSDIECVDPSSS